MKKIIRSTINLFIAASLAISSFAGTIVASAEAGDTLYSFDATAIDSISNTDAADYGIDADTSGTIWGITKQDSSMRESAYYDAIRFSTRGGIGDKELMSLSFANDIKNNPGNVTFENGNYVFTSEFSSLYKDSGYMSMKLSGSAGDLAELRMEPSSGEWSYTNEAYMVDGFGERIGNSVLYKGGNDKESGANANAFAANILYFKVAININAGTYSAWLVQRGTDAKDYNLTEATDADLLIENQPFNTEGITDLTSVSFAVTSSSATNGVWLHNIFIQEGEPDFDPNQSPIERAKSYMEKEYRVTDESYSNITTDLNKPLLSVWNDEVTGEDVEITWTSSNPDFIADDGTYTAPEQPTEDQTVIMTAHLSYKDETAEVSYELTIRKYTNEKLIDSEDFTGKTVVDGTVDGWELYDGSSKVDTFDNLSLSLTDNKLVITKNSTANESDYSERYKTMYRFKDTLEKDTYSKTYRTNLRGEYKVVTSFRPGISTSGSQFQLANIATGGADEAPDRVFAMCIAKPNSSPGVYEYISSTETPQIYKDAVNKTDVTATYYINTESGEMSVQINNGEEYKHDAYAGEALQGMMYIIKSKALAGDTLTVNSIDLYRISGYDDGTDALFADTSDALDISLLTDTPEAVTESLNELPTTIGDAKVEWSSSDELLIDSRGELGERPFDEDKKVTLTAKISRDKATIYKEFYLTVAKEDDVSKILEKAASNVTHETLTNESTENITKSLNTLPQAGLYNTTISWTSSDPSTISNTGELLKLGTKTKIPVTMTAVFTLNGQTYEKNFDFKVGLDFEAGLTTLYETDFSGNTIADNISVTNGAGEIVQQDNQLLLKRNENGGADTSIKVYPAFNGKKINVTGEMIVETDVNLPPGCQKAEVVLYDTNGNRITSFYTTGKGNGPASYTSVYRDSEEGDAVHYVTNVTAGVGLHLKTKVHVNLDTKKMTVYTDTDGNGYKAVATDKYIRENATNLSYIFINALDDTNGGKTYKNTGTLEVNSVKVIVNEGTIPEMITNNIDYFSDILSKNGVTAGDIVLPTENYSGTTVKWTSSNPSIISDSGKYQSDNFDKDENLTIIFRLSLDNDPEIYYERKFDMQVLYVDPNNIAVGKTATSSVISNTGHGPEKAIDGIMSTTWETMRSDETPALTVSLGQKQVISEIRLAEAEILGQYPVKGYVIEVSQDNKRWTTVHTGTTIGKDEQTISISPTAASYVRYRVTSKDTGNSGLKEFGIYIGSDDKSIANADLVLLIDKLGSLTGLTSSVSLPQTGGYGSTFTYSSSIPQYFSDSGVVSRPSSTISGTLTITASYGGATAENSVKISVLGMSSGGGSGSGSGSGSSSSPSRGNGSVAAMPQGNTSGNTSGNTTQNTTVIGFKDVDSGYWGYEYIEILRSRDIVSGDAEGNFRPNDNISREEFLKMLIGALDIDISNAGDTTFEDISNDDWSKPYVAKAVSMGIVNGISDTLFGKGMAITRQDMAIMCTRALKAVGKDVPSGTDAGFIDSAQIGEYALESVNQMFEMGVINGYEDNSFRPYNNATRGEAAKIICKLI